MKKYSDPTISVINFEIDDNTNFDNKIGTREGSSSEIDYGDWIGGGDLTAHSDGGSGMNASLNWM